MAERPFLYRAHTSSAEDDRRTTGRAKRRLRIIWRLLGEKETLMTPGEIYDLSKAGLALKLDAPVRPASILVVKLEDVVPGFEEPFLVRVKHVTTGEEGGWLAGCSFSRQFSEAEFAVLLAISTDPPVEVAKRPCGKREHRNSPREDSQKWLSVCIKPVNLLRPEVLGRLRDRSKGGLGLMSMAAFPAGTILKVRIEQSVAAPWVQVRVKHCRPQERQFALGCQFTEIPSAGALAQFVG